MIKTPKKMSRNIITISLFGNLVFFTVLLIVNSKSLLDQVEDNDRVRPFIGILVVETHVNSPDGPSFKSYIPASYVKWAESLGARVTPIMISQGFSYYDSITNYINGIILPGGNPSLDDHNGYNDAAEILFNLAKQKGVPLWGICLGMEVLSNFFCEANVLTSCSAMGVPLPVQFTPDYRNSRMFKDAPDDVIDYLQNESLTANYHGECVTPETMEATKCTTKWKILATSNDLNGTTFAALLESPDYPIFASQFHPERNQFEWQVGHNMPHTDHAIYIVQYFGRVFMEYVRQNTNQFPSVDLENVMIIYNYQSFYTGYTGRMYEQIYYFNRDRIPTLTDV